MMLSAGRILVVKEGIVARRRRLVRGIPAMAVLAIWLAACSGSGSNGGYAHSGSPTPAVVPAATPPCEGARRITPARDEGPHFKAGSPDRASLLEPGLTGTPLTITGAVLSASCGRVAGAQLDFWQSDDAG